MWFCNPLKFFDKVAGFLPIEKYLQFGTDCFAMFFFDLVGQEASIVFPLIRRESKTHQSPGTRSIEAGSRKVHCYCLHLIQLLEPSTEWTNTRSLILWFLDSFPEGRTELNLSCDKCRGWREPGNKTLRRSRIFGLVLFMRGVTEQEGRPAWQKQSGAGAGRDSWSNNFRKFSSCSFYMIFFLKN